MSFFKRYKNRMIVTTVAIMLIIIIGITVSRERELTGAEKLIGSIFSPIERVFFKLGKNVSNFIGSVKEIGTLREENRNLKLKIAELEEKNRIYEDLIGRTEYLRNEKELIESTNYNLVSASVVGKEPGNWFNRFTIDKGLNDGIRKGNTVIQGVETDERMIQEGIIGRVAEVGPNWSKIVSIVDENSKIAFKIIRTQDGGIISGNDGLLDGYLFDAKADIIEGDKLYSSGLGGIYVKDLYIGQIVEVYKSEGDLTKLIEVEPIADFKKLYKVFVICD